MSSNHSFLSGWSAQRPMLRAWNHQSDLFFFCSGGLEKGKTLVHPTTTPWIVAGFDKIGKSRVPKSSNWARFMLFSFPTSWFLGSASAFFGGSETSDTSLRAPVRAPGGPADVRVVVLPLGTSAQNALGPLSWGARAGDRWGQGWKKGGPKFPRKSYAWIISMTEADSKLCLSRIVL